MHPTPESPHVATFHVEVHPERERVRVEPVGELDLATAPALEEQLSELRDSGFDSVVLDLRRLTCLDSTGIALILKEDRYARENSHAFVLIKGPAEVQRVLGVCGVVGELTFVGSEAPRPIGADQGPEPSANAILAS